MAKTSIRLKKKIINVIKKLDDVKEEMGTRLFFESLPEENKRDYYNAVHALKILNDNL